MVCVLIAFLILLFIRVKLFRLCLCLCFFTKEWALTKFIEAMKHASLTCEHAWDACFPSQVLEWVKMLWGVRQCVEEADGEVDEQRGDVLQTD